MAVISPSTLLTGSDLKAFHATDPALSHSIILVLYGTSSAAGGGSIVSSRIQTHVFTPAGFQSYSRLTIVPGSPLYKAVECLPREQQGDEVCRALAYSLLKYFSELSEAAKQTWTGACMSPSRPKSAFRLFGEEHAGDVARRMNRVPDPSKLIESIERNLCAQSLSHLDIDVILPPGSIQRRPGSEGEPTSPEDEDHTTSRYGAYAPLVKLFGEPAFIPTSRVRRAPSKPTGISRSPTFSRAQKESLRRDLCELVDTEERYVGKLYDLIHSVAADFREKAAKKPPQSASPSAQALAGLFPPSLDLILQVNTGFLEAMRTLLDETENEAINDIQTSNDSSTPNPSHQSADSTGAVLFAKCFLDWFPEFAICYGDYIRAHASFGQCLKVFMSETGSSFAKRVQETGEQRLMSMLIEPVQRLPRYGLYIETFVKQLPLGHPAVKPLLKAKDIVAEICAQDTPMSSASEITDRFRRSILAWPAGLHIQSRLITAIDATEVSPSSHPRPDSSPAKLILLLFADHLVLLSRPFAGSTTARTVLAQVDNLAMSSNTSPDTLRQFAELEYHSSFGLDDVHFCEVDGGNATRLLRITSERVPTAKTDWVLRLDGSYDGKAGRLTKDIVRARIEGRFSEIERESPKWEARDTDPTDNVNLGLFSAVFEDNFSEQERTRQHKAAAFTVVIDPARGTKNTTPGENGVEVVASISSKGDGFYKLEVEAVGEKGTHDHVTVAEFLPVLTKRFANILQMKNQIRNPAIAIALFQHYQAILKSLPIVLNRTDQGTVKGHARSQSSSPVKKLASLFSASSGREQSNQKTVPLTPSIDRALQPLDRPALKKSPSKRGNNNGAVPHEPESTVIRQTNDQSDAFDSLEKTLRSYLLALHARKGNIVGRVVASRVMADEAVVNELYNTLLENPLDHERAAQSPVDVLFAAFEKFLKIAWKDKLGPVLAGDVLEDMQTKSELLGPLDFEEYLISTMAKLAPQNLRALKSIVALLADLLDGTSNDGDRGILTAAISEMVICDGDWHASIPLFDKLVEEQEMITDISSRSGTTTPYPSSLTSNTLRSTNQGSISSKASSFSKRLGLGSLKRQNSNKDSKFGSTILRSLSKRQAEERSPVSLNRTQSVDQFGRPISLSRPNSQGHASVLSAFDQLRPSTGESQGQSEKAALGLATVGGPVTPKKKRRSSLSDLKSLPVPNTSPFWATPSLQRPDGSPSMRKAQATPPRTPSPIRHPMNASPSRLPSLFAESPAKKENIRPLTPRGNHASKPPSLLASATFDENLRSPNSMQNNPADSSTASAASVPKGVLTERVASGNTPPPPLQPTRGAEQNDSPKRLRISSPQKLRERVSNQQKAIAKAESTLQDELEKIGEELSGLRLRSGDDAGMDPANSPSKREQAELANLGTRMKALETKLPHLIKNLTEHVNSLERDLSSTVQVAEKKARRLDVQLKQANAENQALYQQTNDKLADVFNKVQSGDGVEELRRLLRESQDEAARWKTENMRLRRENAGLRAQLNEG